MIRCETPGIDTDELLLRVRQEAALASERSPAATAAPPPALTAPRPSQVDWPRVEADLTRAKEHAYAGYAVPQMRRFGRLIRPLARGLARTVLWTTQIISFPQRIFNDCMLRVLETLTEETRRQTKGLTQQNSAIEQMRQQLAELKCAVLDIEATQVGRLQQVAEELRAEFRDPMEALGDLGDMLQHRILDLESEMSSLTAFYQVKTTEIERLIAAEKTRNVDLSAQITAKTAELQARLENLSSQTHRLQESVDQVQQSLVLNSASRDARDERLEETIEKLGDRLAQDSLQTERSVRRITKTLTDYERRLMLLSERGRRGQQERRPAAGHAGDDQELLEALYVSFEDEFRGTRDDIKDRLRVYLPVVREARAGAEQTPIIDLGCGRGEWLELLREECLVGRGIDVNEVLLRQCRDRELEVVHCDALGYLRQLGENSVGAVTGFHLIEHLAFADLIRLLDETVRVLRPGGVAVFETPNPQNLQVGSHTFYMDPTHRNPLPGAMMQFMAQARGLTDVRIMPRNPYPQSAMLSGGEIAQRLNGMLYGPQDYAVVGRKA